MPENTTITLTLTNKEATVLAMALAAFPSYALPGIMMDEQAPPEVVLGSLVSVPEMRALRFRLQLEGI